MHKTAGKLVPASLVFVFAACGGPAPESDPGTVAAAPTADDQALVIAPKTTRVVGSIEYGQTSADVKYSSSPKYRAFSFTAQKGDHVDAWVRSDDGDAMAWLLNARFEILDKNDNAATGVSDSHIQHTLGVAGTHYIAFREHDSQSASFKVYLNVAGVGNFYSCQADSDCVAVPVAECCGTGHKMAVNKHQTTAYENSYTCPQPNQVCPLYLIDDTRQAECDVVSHQCQMVDITAIHCGGFTVNPHQCPSGYSCKYGGVPDVPGKCVAN
jgi:hypothetical protein